jgi:transcriptional regulator with XRE-family HTH domain
MVEKRRPAWAVRLQAEREKREWTKREMARRLLQAAGYTHGSLDSLIRQIRDWEKGRHFPRDWIRAYATAFGIDVTCLFSEESPENRGENDDMERRRLLQALATLGVPALAPPLDAIQSIREGVDRALGRDESTHLDEWQETIAEYGYRYMALPPERLIAELSVDVYTVQQTMARIGTGDRNFPEWCRVTAMLSLLTAKTLFNLGHTTEARRWWATAQSAADRSGDPTVSLYVTGEGLTRALYEDRPTPALLTKINKVESQATAVPCSGLAKLAAVRAQALALDGRTNEAIAALRDAHAIYEKLPDSVTKDVVSLFGWAADRLLYTETWVHAYTGRGEAAAQTARRALDILPASDIRSRTQLALLQGLGHVRGGDVTEGIRQARTAYENHPPEQRTAMISHLADQVLAAVPPQRRAEPTVTEFRDLLVSARV